MMTAIETINQFFQSIVDKDAAKIGTFYVQDEQTYVVLEGPRLTTLGFSKIQKGWVDFCDSKLKLVKIEWLEGAFSEEEPTMAWVGGVVKLTIAIESNEFTQTFRASFVLKKAKNTEGGVFSETQLETNWLIRHEHVSGALTDPYGIGDWLKKK
jgi:ketosteroid isomerase-like protein